MINKELFGPALRRNTLMAALALLIVGSALLILLNQPAEAQANTRAASNLSLSSTSPGELVITWDAPSDAPDDYRVTWKKSGGKWPSYKNENTAQGGNAFPTGTSHTVTGLEEGTGYSARVRARYHDGNGNLEQSGPWTATQEITVAQTPLPTKPTGLLAATSHNSVLLSWTDPSDNGITGYQVLRGQNADNLAVRTADTGSASTSYNDDTVEAQTTYVYAIRARNAHGLSPQSDTVSVTTPAAPPAKPTGFTHGASYNNVLLLWTDPGDSSITGYQVLRGDDADNLAVLTGDTGNANTDYTDDTVEAETTYAYAIRARNAGGLGPQSDTVSVTTQPAPPEPVEPVADMATAAGAPTISGTPMVGQTLTADTSGITDADGLTTPRWTYQWVRVSADLTENDISGATSQTYKLVTGDVGNKIKVVVSFTDDTSESESRPSEPFPEHKFVVEQSELVSNRDQGSRTHLGNGLSAIRSQGFRTGPHPHGYDISTAVLRFAGGSLPASRFSLTIYSSNTMDIVGGRLDIPGDELYEFVDPSTISTGFVTFTAPEGFHLEPNTDYFLRLWGDGSSSLFPSLADTTKEDSDSAHGWTIANDHLAALGGASWAIISNRLVMELLGSETSGPGPAAESLTVTSTPTNPTNYLTGDTITFALRFDESAMASGDPELEFDIGGTKRRAAYDSAASSGATVVFSYTVVSDDQDTDGIDIGFIADAIKLDTDDSIQDADSNAATYGSVKLSRQADHRVNAAPGIASIEVTSTPVAPRYYGPSEDIHITVTFDTPVTVTGNPEFEFSLGNAGEARNVLAQYNAGLSTTTDVVFTYTVLPTDEDSNGIFLRDGTTSIKLDTDDSIQDANNKDASLTYRALSAQGNHRIDPRPRTVSVEVTSTPTAGTNTYGAGEIIEFTLTFNQPLILTGEPHYVFSLGNSGVARRGTATYDAGRSSARSLVFTYRVVSTDVDNNGIYLYAGNTSFVLETGETVRNKFGNDARTDYGGDDAEPDHKVDGSLTPANTPPGGLPTISGTAEVGQTLTASTTGITDDDGLTTPPGWTYQWIRVDTEGTETDIPGATSQTYTLVSGDEVLQFRVRVSFTDDGGATETLRSAIFPSSRGPNAPETLSLSNDRGDVTLDWTPPTDPGSSAITKYQYRVSDDGGNTWSPDFTDVPDQNSDSDQADERSYTISSLTLGTEHTIEVRAHNAGAPGAPASGTITPATTPGRPQSVNATAGNQKVELTWSAPSSDGGSPITHYQYRVRDETDSVWLPAFTNGFVTVPDSDADMDLADELSIIVTGLANGHEHKFFVRAHNAQGGGSPAETAATPLAPLELTVHPVATDGVINIEEKANGFNITGQVMGVEGVAITVVIGASGNLTGTSDSGGSWLVAVPPNASYIAESALDMTVSATASGYEATDVTRQVTVDLTKPTVQTATVNGVAVTLTYSEPLRTTARPPATAYQVNVDGAAAPLATSNPVTISGSAVIITLAAAVSSTATVTLDYTVPTGIGERPIQDQSRNPADGFTGQAVTVITLVIIDTPTLETGEDGTTDTFNVKLAGTPSANVSIALASSDTGEGTVSPTPLTFTSTNWDTDQTVTVTGVDDTDQDGDQSYEITFAVTSTDTDYNGITVPPVKVTNIDDEASNDATLSGLALTDAGNNAISLTPAFASEVLSYTAAVTNPVSQIKVEPTRNETNATILYLDSADMALADADGTTTNVFDVNLAEGENVFKIKVTAEDGTTTKTYVVTVTRDVVKVLVSNFSASQIAFSTAGEFAGGDYTAAQAFTTGENAGGYLINSVKLFLQRVILGDVPVISIHHDDDGRPGTVVDYLINPPLPQTIVPSEYIFTAPPDTVLSARTTYWLLIGASSGSVPYSRVGSTAEDAGHDPEWSIGDSRLVRDADTADWGEAATVVKMSVSGSTRTGVDSTDATLSDLVIKEGSNNVPLEPAFDYGVRTYTAMVAMAATQIRVEPTRNDDTAAIQYLDSADAALTDADLSTPDVFDVNLAEGDTVVKVKVTAEDTTTIKTYQVTVSRVDFLVSNVNSIVDDTIYGVSGSRPQVAIQFMTGSYPHGYTIDMVRLRARATAGTTPRVSIHSDSSGEPGSRLRALDNLGTIPTSFAWIDFDASDLGLDPNTPYWIVLDRASGNHEFVFRTTQSTAEDAGTAAGWSIGDRLQETTSVGGPWNPVTGFPLIPQLTIKGEQVEPAMILTGDFTSIIRELHELTFTLTRTGSTAETAFVTLWLENETGSAVITSSPRNQNLTFGIGVDTLEFTVPLDWISAVTGTAGNFRASVEAGSEYDLSDAVTTVEVLHPTSTLIEVRLDKNSYKVTEGDTLSFNVLFNVLQKIEAPNRDFAFITLRSHSGTADFADAPNLSVFARVQPSAWNLVADRYSATFPVTHQTSEDALYERPMGEHERYEIETLESSFTPGWVTRKGPATGTTRYPVTIIDDETLNLNAELSSTGITAGANLRIDEDAGQDVTLTVTNTDLASDGNPVTLPPGVKLKITPDIPTNRGAARDDDWTITPDEIDLGGTATITIIDDMLDEGPESVTFEVGFEDDAMFQSARATLTINDDEYSGPALQSAEINGAILTLEFSNTLDETSRPTAGSFIVKVKGAAVSLASTNPVTISGSTVTLRLRSAVPAGDTVTVSYTEPGTNPIQDTDSLVVPSFTDEPVSNDERVASIEAVKSPILEGEEEVQFRITLSREPPAGGVNIRVEIAPLIEYIYDNPVSVDNYRTHNVHIGQGQTEAILEILTTRDEIASNTKAVTATLLPNTGYTVGSNSEGTVSVDDPDQVNIRFAAGCGETITVGEGDGEAYFDIVLDNPVAFRFSLSITTVTGLATQGNDYSGRIQILQFDNLETRVTLTVPILEDAQLEHTEDFFIRILRSGLDPDILTPTCGLPQPHLTIEITDNDTANIVLDAPEQVIEGQPIKLGLGPRPNVLCPVPFTVTTTLTITGDTNALQDNPGTSVSLELPPCASPQNVHIEKDDGTEAAPVWQTIDDPGPLGDRHVTFTIGPLMSDDSLVSKLILERTSATVTIQNKPNATPTGRPTLSGQEEVAHSLSASTTGIEDSDGLRSPGYTYQWQRQDGGVYTDIAGADSMVYTLTAEDEGKQVRVQVTLTDDRGNIHTLQSAPTRTVQAQQSLPAGKVAVSLDATAYVVEEGQSIQVTVTLAEAPEDQHVHIPFTVTPDNGAIQADFTAGSTFTRQLRYNAGDTTDRINISADDDTLDDEGETLTLCLVDLPEPYAVLAGRDCATINILDNDDPNSVQVTFGRENYWASEDGNPAWPRIWVYPVPDREITIPITFTPGGRLSAADHGAVTTSVKFGPGLYGVHGDGHLTDGRTYAGFPIEIWAIDDVEDDDGEYMDLAFGEMPPFVSVGATGKFSYQPTTTRVWFNDNEFTQVPVTDPPNPLGFSKQMKVTFADAELEAKEGLYDNGRVATVLVQLSRRRDMESTVVIPITVTHYGGAAPGVDYDAGDVPSQLTFLPGQTEQSFRVRAVNDDIDDDGEYLTLSFGTLPDDLVYAGDQASLRIDLVDDDDPPVQVFFEQANYEVTSTYRSGPRVYARLEVTVQLSAIPERFVDVGIVAESTQGSGRIRFGTSAYIPRGPHSGAAFNEDETEFTVTVVMSATDGFDADQTYRLRFDGMSYKMSAGSPATATITIDPAQTSEPASQDWPADTTTRAVLTLNQCVDGNLVPAADADWMKMLLQAGQGYAFNVQSEEGTLKVYDHSGMNPATLTDWVDSGSNHYRVFYRAAADGVHYFGVQRSYETGDYLVCLGRDDHGSDLFTATAMQVSEHVPGNIWREGDRGPVIEDEDSFKIPLVANRTYHIEVRGTGENGVDVGGTLADPQFTLARIIDNILIFYLQGVSADGGAGKNESYTFTATHTTDYYIEVYDGSSPDKGGTYTVSVGDIT